MRTLQEEIQRLRRMRETIIANRQSECLRIALDGLALVKLRIQTRGEAYDGSSFAPYTQPHKNKRTKLGYQTTNKDFTMTGQMFGSIKPVIVQNTPAQTKIAIRASTATNQSKLDGQRRKHGNILLLSDDETKMVQSANRQRILKHLQ